MTPVLMNPCNFSALVIIKMTIFHYKTCPLGKQFKACSQPYTYETLAATGVNSYLAD
jgi:hypothetical protein